jgi:hypothetical protein
MQKTKPRCGRTAGLCCISLGLLLLCTGALHAQNARPVEPGSRKQATAVRVESRAIEVDGDLSEDVWQGIPPIVDFVQAEPNEGAPPTQKMEIRFAYDETALYVGARMYSSDPAAIQAPLGRRDNASEQSEHLLISFDTFLDRRTAYTFGVSASGVRFDHFHPADDQDDADEGYNPVWEAKTRIDAGGWTAELWIPLSQLRFNDRSEQVWGLNVQRFTPTLEEQVYWVLVPRTEKAWASRFGDLTGISNIRRMRRIELLPVVVGSSRLTGQREGENPFDDGRNLSSRVGADLKMGLGPNLTLDATINPDFGQVEADPAEVNLTAFATRFSERRPFFTEGAQLLNLNHNNVFYSRRIGRAPVGPASGDFVDYPQTSRIMAASKITGRLPRGTSIGVLAAVTDEEHARVFDRAAPQIRQIRVAPRTAYGLSKVQQEFGEDGSTASVLVAAVHRDLNASDPLASTLSQNALVYGGDAVLRFNRGEYEARAALVGSYVGGQPAAIERMQRSSAHYFQRPDRTSGRLDPTLTSLSGLSAIADFDRRGGRHWLFGTHVKIDSNRFETNDIGLLNSAESIEPNAEITYRETQPGAVFRSYRVTLDQSYNWDLSRNLQRGTTEASVNTTWANVWTTSGSISRGMRTQDASLTRGGPLIGGPRNWSLNVEVANSATSQTRWSGDVTVTEDELGGGEREVEGSFSFRPTPRWELSIAPSYVQGTDAQQYVTTLAGGRPETFNNRYVFAYIDRSTLSLELRAAYTFMPDLNLDVYAEPFAASGSYYDYGELLEPASLSRITYGTSGTTMQVRPDGSRAIRAGNSEFVLSNNDFNVRSFNSNVVLRWEWRPGTTLYLVWQQNRESREPIGSRIGVRDLFGSITETGTNILLFKTSFWIPVK